jgi:hypothetical protein
MHMVIYIYMIYGVYIYIIYTYIVNGFINQHVYRLGGLSLFQSPGNLGGSFRKSDWSWVEHLRESLMICIFHNITIILRKWYTLIYDIIWLWIMYIHCIIPKIFHNITIVFAINLWRDTVVLKHILGIWYDEKKCWGYDMMKKSACFRLKTMEKPRTTHEILRKTYDTILSKWKTLLKVDKMW